MIVTATLYETAVSGILDRLDYWYEEYLSCNLNTEQWQRKQLKYEKKLIKIQTARIETIKLLNNEHR
jgi:hypothetical protein